jgi:hypothetical protein
MEITYRRTIQVREYESITIEAKCTSDGFYEEVGRLEELVDTELAEHRVRLLKEYKEAEFEDDEDLS